jgi:hypothetical protein
MAEGCPHDEVVRRFRKLGFAGPFNGSKHPFMVRTADQRKVVLAFGHGSRKRGKDAPPAMVSFLIRGAGISKEQWDIVGDPDVKSLLPLQMRIQEDVDVPAVNGPDKRRRKGRRS